VFDHLGVHRCMFEPCAGGPRFVFASQLFQHQAQQHRAYHCPIGDCEINTLGKLRLAFRSSEELRRHMVRCHEGYHAFLKEQKIEELWSQAFPHLSAQDRRHRRSSSCPNLREWDARNQGPGGLRRSLKNHPGCSLDDTHTVD
jgi:hypothetical protein